MPAHISLPVENQNIETRLKSEILLIICKFLKVMKNQFDIMEFHPAKLFILYFNFLSIILHLINNAEI